MGVADLDETLERLTPSEVSTRNQLQAAHFLSGFLTNFPWVCFDVYAGSSTEGCH